MPDKKQLNFSKLGIYAILFIMAVVIVFPIYWMLLTTFQPTSQATAYPPALFFQSFSFDKLQEVVVQTNVLKWIVNSFIVAFGVVVVNLLVSVPAAYSMARYKIRFNKILLFAVLITQMIPPAIMVVPLFEIFASVGLNNKLLSLILADSILTLPIGTWILIGFFENIPKEIEEAAIMDGASKMMLFYRISLPLTYPAMVTVAILTFFDAWNEYMYAYTFITDQAKWVGTVGVASFMGQFLTDWQAVMASSLIFSILPMTIYIFLRKYIVRGVSEGFAK
jgi:multiple sugar transport system permease protein